MLKLENVSTFYGSVPVLRNMNLEVPKGSITVLLGANGAGKTTTINTILGFVKPTEGNVYHKGEIITGVSTEQIIARGIGVVPEGRRVFPKMSVEDNLMVGACTLKDKTQLKRNIEMAYTLFPRLAERRWQNAGTMSGGEQQMLAMSRALMSNPEVILMDEPSMGLAPLVVNDIFNTIKTVNAQGVTVLLVEQNGFKALALAQRAYLLQKGQIIASCDEAIPGSKEELKNKYLLAHG